MQVKAFDLVKRVTSLGSGLVRRKRDAAVEGTAEKPTLALRATLRLIRASTLVARGMQRLPHPPLGAQEKLALGAARDQLEAMKEQAAAAAAASGPLSPETALVDLIGETVKLVERMLEGPKEMEERRVKGELTEVAEGSERTKISF
jgi:hypothetical protein